MGSLGRVDLEWGWDGAGRAAARGDRVVIVDVLRFSTSVAAHVASGAVVAVTPWKDGADTGLLSPRTARARTETVTLASLNGAQCTLRAVAAGAPAVFAGALVNARAVAAVLRAGGAPITVVACGERWPDAGDDGALRFAVEDLLGAGAIIAALGDLPSTPEAKAARAAFRSARHQLRARLLASASGQELVEKGLTDDVHDAAGLDTLACVPLWQNEKQAFSNAAASDDRSYK